jgi:endonuclease/exonuclease/phosphatase family metal-dependent hydrolase
VFFDALPGLGLHDATRQAWPRRERPTRKAPDYQLDHVLVSKGWATRVAVANEKPAFDTFSDHAPVRFTVAHD